MAPSKPRRKGTAKAPQDAAQSAAELNAPPGAVVADAPDKGLWLALVDTKGRPVTQDGKPVRLQ